MPGAQIPCQRKQVVAQAIDVAKRDDVLVGFRFDLDRAAFGAAADSAGHVGQ